MKNIIITLLMAMTITTCTNAQVNGEQKKAANSEQKKAANGEQKTAVITDQPKQVYDETLNTMTQIDDAISKAKADGKYVICQVGGNWCPWCLKFAKFITEDAEIKAFVEQNYVYIHVNYPRRGGNRDAQAETMKRLGNPQRFGFPVMVVLNSDGKVVHIQDSSYLEDGGSYNKEKVMSFFKNWTKDNF